MLAQQAGTMTLAQAYIIAKNQTSSIYTDSWYAFSVTQDCRMLWKQRGFLTSKEQPIKNNQCVFYLLTTLNKQNLWPL